MTNMFIGSTEPSNQQRMIGNVSKLNKSELVDLLDNVKSLQAILRQLVPPITSEPIEFDTWYQIALKIVGDEVKQDVAFLHSLDNRNEDAEQDNEKR